jgi:xanthine dehydrogenase YagS FAD-binding subunit
MRAFEYATATAFDEALGLLGADGSVRPLAGGTDLLPLMKADVAHPQRLVDVKHLPELAAGITETTDGLALGALTTLTAIETSPLLRGRYTAIAEAAGLAASPQLRNMATLGGNLLQRPRCWYFRSSLFHCWLKGGETCHAREGQNQLHALFDDSPCVAVHASDPPAALLAFDAELALSGRGGSRSLPLAAFFSLPTDDHRLETVLEPNELIVSIRLPTPVAGTRSTYLKAMNRKVWAFALVGVAAVVRLEQGRVAHARLVLSGVAPIPWRAHAAERELIGAELTDSAIEHAAEVALAEARPLNNNAYKVPLARALIRQSLHTLRA